MYQGVSIASELALGDSAFGFWKAVIKHLANDASSVLLGTQNGQYIKQSPKICSTKNKRNASRYLDDGDTTKGT
ncbi:hypothetical protein [Candidatus Enterovibrio escicola]|uniref:hypothetical protein n=1 Tax=Candidatus Enterovibrio escicola TaxID=1927127 RepID=UPI003742ECDA